MRIAAYLLAAGLAACAVRMSGVQAAEAALTGAWLQGGLACEDVFARAGKAVTFKKPVNIFAPAFIISGDRLRTPQASCRIKRVKAAGERRTLTLGCATTISVGEVTALLGVAENGTLRRYFDDKDQSGSSYNRCNL
jgi:hypothetical protein